MVIYSLLGSLLQNISNIDLATAFSIYTLVARYSILRTTYLQSVPSRGRQISIKIQGSLRFRLEHLASCHHLIQGVPLQIRTSHPLSPFNTGCPTRDRNTSPPMTSNKPQDYFISLDVKYTYKKLREDLFERFWHQLMFAKENTGYIY